MENSVPHGPCCSFCGLNGVRLISGPHVYICHECVRTCYAIIGGPSPKTESDNKRLSDEIVKRGTAARSGMDALSNLLNRYKCACGHNEREPCISCRLIVVAKSFRGVI